MFCIKCGKEIPENSAFCEHCGARQLPYTVHQEGAADHDRVVGKTASVTEKREILCFDIVEFIF